MTAQHLSALLDEFERSAHAASVNEEDYRREVAVRLKELASSRAFGFRRLNLMRTVVAAIETCETEEEAMATGSAAFLREVGWSAEERSPARGAGEIPSSHSRLLADETGRG